MTEESKSTESAAPIGQLVRFRNWLSFAGMVLAASALGAFVLLFLLDLFSEHSNPYTGILAYVVAPGFLLAGMAMTLLGYILETRRIKRDGVGSRTAFIWHVDLTRKRDRRVLVMFLLGSTGFLFLTAFGSYETYHLMETNNFCGKTCHTPMEPEFEAYQHSPHAQVACVDCHIGPGAAAYVKVKLNGVKQMYHAVAGDFERPIKIKSQNLRLTDQTCQDCHWAQKHHGNKVKSYRHFLADEENTPFTVNMVLKLGGSDPLYGPVEGIHAHMDPTKRIEYMPVDETLAEIPWIRVTDKDGKVTEYRSEGFEGEVSADMVRTMGCIDCHNRPAHRFIAPNDSVDRAIATGVVDVTIPSVKLHMVEALTGNYATREEAQEKIKSYLKEAYPDDERVDGLIAEALAIYAKNFYPEMKTDWSVHPDFIGHKNTMGCFRCHDGAHVAADDTPIKSSGCNDCHIIVSQGSGEELKDVKPEGHDAFLHVDSEYEDYDCSSCHTGKNQEE